MKVGHIDSGGKYSGDLSVFTAENSVSPLNLSNLVICAQYPVFIAVGWQNRSIKKTAHNIVNARTIFHRDKLFDPGFPYDLLFGQADDIASCLVDHGDVAILVKCYKRNRGDIKVSLRAVSFLRNRFFRLLALCDIAGDASDAALMMRQLHREYDGLEEAVIIGVFNIDRPSAEQHPAVA